jgi:hypothetical protein
MKQLREPPFQPVPLLGWIWTIFYWIICLLVGVQFNYVVKWYQHMKRLMFQGIVLSDCSDASAMVRGVLTFIAIIVTVQAQRQLRMRYTSFGRPDNMKTRWVFGIVNGVLETFMFTAVYDFGRGAYLLLSDGYAYFPPRPTLRLVSGSLLLTSYLGLIHALFWAPCVFPKHLKDDAPPFHKQALLPLFVITVAMMAPYVCCGDMVLPSLVHIYVDLDAVKTMHLPSPFSACKIRLSNGWFDKPTGR